MNTGSKRRNKAQSQLAALAEDELLVKMHMAFAEGPTSAVRLAEKFKAKRHDVNYRVVKLREWGAIELIDEVKRRGATEHIYRAIELPLINTDQWREMPQPAREAFSREILRRHVADLVVALEERTFDSRVDRAAIRFPMLLDEVGCRELYDLCVEVYERQQEIQARSDARRARFPDSPTVPMMGSTFAFPRRAGPIE